MIGYVLGACVAVLAVLVVIALARAGLREVRRSREAREMRAARLALLADARRAAEERARSRVPPAPQPVVGLTAVFEKLEQSARFARAPTPLPAPPARMPRASVPPPIPPQARAPRPRMPEGAYPIVRPKR